VFCFRYVTNSHSFIILSVQFIACPDSLRATRSADRSLIWTCVGQEHEKVRKKKKQSARSNNAERTQPVKQKILHFCHTVVYLSSK